MDYEAVPESSGTAFLFFGGAELRERESRQKKTGASKSARFGC